MQGQQLFGELSMENVPEKSIQNWLSSQSYFAVTFILFYKAQCFPQKNFMIVISIYFPQKIIAAFTNQNDSKEKQKTREFCVLLTYAKRKNYTSDYTMVENRKKKRRQNSHPIIRERANGRASGPVLQSVFLAVIDHSALMNL